MFRRVTTVFGFDHGGNRPVRAVGGHDRSVSHALGLDACSAPGCARRPLSLMAAEPLVGIVPNTGWLAAVLPGVARVGPAGPADPERSTWPGSPPDPRTAAGERAAPPGAAAVET